MIPQNYWSCLSQMNSRTSLQKKPTDKLHNNFKITVLVKFSCLWMRKDTTFQEIRILLPQFCCRCLFRNGKLTYTTQRKPYLWHLAFLESFHTIPYNGHIFLKSLHFMDNNNVPPPIKQKLYSAQPTFDCRISKFSEVYKHTPNLTTDGGQIFWWGNTGISQYTHIERTQFIIKDSISTWVQQHN